MKNFVKILLCFFVLVSGLKSEELLKLTVAILPDLSKLVRQR